MNCSWPTSTNSIFLTRFLLQKREFELLEACVQNSPDPGDFPPSESELIFTISLWLIQPAVIQFPNLPEPLFDSRRNAPEMLPVAEHSERYRPDFFSKKPTCFVFFFLVLFGVFYNKGIGVVSHRHENRTSEGTQQIRVLPVCMAHLMKSGASFSRSQPWRAACIHGIWKILFSWTHLQFVISIYL